MVVKVSLPLALPGLTAAAIFTWVLSWNDVFAASILTLRNPTLPAHTALVRLLADRDIARHYLAVCGGVLTGGGTIDELRKHGCSDEELFETVAVTALFNFMDRMADALGAPVEGFQDMIENMSQQQP